MLPVAVSLVGTRLRGASMLFIGWFGPRGLASIVLGLIVVAEAPQLAGGEEIQAVVALTVLLSVLLHGVTAAPLSEAFAHRVDLMTVDAPEKGGTLEVPTHGDPVPSSGSQGQMRPDEMPKRKDPGT
jgi:NhaP-type Na+/H+ or K+/H+ antiporter